MSTTAKGKMELSKSNIIELMHVLEILYNNPNALDHKVTNQMIADRAKINPGMSLLDMKESLRILYEGLSEVIYDLKLELRESTANPNQPKYRLSTVAEIFKVSRQTAHNWCERNVLHSIKGEGAARYVLESDLKKRYSEVFNYELKIDDEFRNEYQYNR